jgi:small subunit ribosomal protein S13
MGVTKPKDEYEEKTKLEKKKEIPKPKRVEEQVETKAIVRLVNTDLDGEKPLMMALRGIKGIGSVMSNAVCFVSGLDPKTKLGNLSESDREKLEKIIKDPLSSGIPSYLINRRKDPETGKDFHLTSSDFDVARKSSIKIIRGARARDKVIQISGR